MAITIKANEMQYKDMSGVYRGLNAVSEKKTADQVADLDACVEAAKTAVNTLNTQKNEIAETIASMAELGTDSTLSTPGMAADAAACGDLKSAIKYIAPVTITGKYVNSNGTIGESGTRYITDYIPCVPGATVYYKGETNRTDISALTFYNASKSPIEMHCNDGAINTLYSTTAPANTAYMVLSWSTTASGAVSADGTVFSVINSIFNKLDSIDSEFDAADTRMDGIDDDIEAVENVISADEDKSFGQRKAVDDLAEILKNEETVSFTSEGKYYAISAPYTAISNSNFKLAEISVTEGELYNISCKLIATDAVAGIMAYKDSSHFFGYELQGTTGTVVTVTDYPYIVPKGVTLLRINATTDNPVIKKLTGDKNSLLWRIPLNNFVNAAYFNTSTNKYVTYTSQTTTYGIYTPIKLLGTETKIHIRTNAVNALVAKIAFLNSATPSTGSIVSLWANQAVGEFDVSIPSGATHVCIANDCNTSGVMLGNPEASFFLSEVYDSIAKNESDIAEMKLSSFDSLVYTDRFNTQRRDSLANTMAKLKAGTLKYTILGDSITDTWDGHNQAGGGASDTAHGYAKIVFRWLKDKYGNNISFTNNGTGGITVTGTMEVVDTYIEDQGFDLCIVELGTNDWNVQTSISTFKTNYKALLDTILAYDNPPEIAIIGLGYFGDWHSERAIKEKQYNDALREIAVEYDVPFVDPYDGMKEEIDFGTYTFEDITYTLDPVHPNDTGHRIWANELYKMFAGLMS